MPSAERHGRLDADTRREALLDVAKELAKTDGPAAVTMGNVAAKADVTRALVYKHFKNRGEILSALYRREAAALDVALRAQVFAAPDGFEPKLRAFVRAMAQAAHSREVFFGPLRGVARDDADRRRQHERNEQTLDYYVDLAVREFDIDASQARPALSALLAGIAMLAHGEALRSGTPTEELEDLCADLAIGALQRLRDRRG